MLACVRLYTTARPGKSKSHIKAKLAHFMETGEIHKMTPRQQFNKDQRRLAEIKREAASARPSPAKSLLLLRAKYDNTLLTSKSGQTINLAKLKPSDLNVSSDLLLPLFESLMEVKKINRKSIDPKILLVLLGASQQQLKDPFLVTEDVLKLLERDQDVARALHLCLMAKSNGQVGMNAILQWCFEHGKIDEATKTLAQRKKWGIPANEQTYIHYFSGLSKHYEWGQVLDDLVEKCVAMFGKIDKPSIEIFNACLSVLVKNYSSLQTSAWDFFDNLDLLDLWPTCQTFTIFLNGVKKFHQSECSRLRKDQNMSATQRATELFRAQAELVTTANTVLARLKKAAIPPVPPTKEEAAEHPELLVMYRKQIRQPVLDIDPVFASTFILCYINSNAGTSYTTTHGSHYLYVQQGLEYLRMWCPEVESMLHFVSKLAVGGEAEAKEKVVSGKETTPQKETTSETETSSKLEITSEEEVTKAETPSEEVTTSEKVTSELETSEKVTSEPGTSEKVASEKLASLKTQASPGEASDGVASPGSASSFSPTSLEPFQAAAKPDIQKRTDFRVEAAKIPAEFAPSTLCEPLSKDQVNPLVIFPPPPFSTRKTKAIFSGKQKHLVDFGRPTFANIKKVVDHKDYVNSKGKYGKKMASLKSISLSRVPAINRFLLGLALDALIKLGLHKEFYLAMWYALTKWGGIYVNLKQLAAAESGGLVCAALPKPAYPELKNTDNSEPQDRSADGVALSEKIRLTPSHDNSIIDNMLVENFIYKMEENFHHLDVPVKFATELVASLVSASSNMSGTLEPREKTFDCVFSILNRDIHLYNDKNIHHGAAVSRRRNLADNTPKRSLTAQQLRDILDPLLDLVQSIMVFEANQYSLAQNRKSYMLHRFVESCNTIFKTLYSTTWSDAPDNSEVVVEIHKKIIHTGILFYRPKPLVDLREKMVHTDCIIASLDFVYKRLNAIPNLDRKDKKLLLTIRLLFQLDTGSPEALSHLKTIAWKIHTLSK